MKELDVTEQILFDIMQDLKIKFEITNCNKTAVGYLDSYNLVRHKFEEYSKDIQLSKIHEKMNINLKSL